MVGKKERFDQLFKDSRDRIYRLCRLYTADTDYQKDLMQEIFLKVWINIDKFKGNSSISTWIYRIAINTCLTSITLLKKEGEMRKVISEQSLLIPESTGDINAQVAWLVGAVNKLEPVDRSLITLYLESFSHREIGEIMGMSEGSIRVRIHRIRQHLSEMADGVRTSLQEIG